MADCHVVRGVRYPLDKQGGSKTVHKSSRYFLAKYPLDKLRMKELNGDLRKSRRYCSCRLIIWTSERPLGHLTRELSDKIVHLTQELSDKSRVNSGVRV